MLVPGVFVYAFMYGIVELGSFAIVWGRGQVILRGRLFPALISSSKVKTWVFLWS